MYSGSCRDNLARSETRLLCVALKSKVCRCLGRYSMMASRVCLKPMSSTRSASSSTSICRLSTLNVAVSERCCSIRPGVHTTIFILGSASCSSRKCLPPITKPAAKKCPCPPTVRRTSNIWMASSLVGVMIKAPRPASPPMHCVRYRFSRTGMRNAKVLPLPVFAAPRTSFPFKASGMALAWMSVRLLKCAVFNPAFVGSERGRSVKEECLVVWTSSSRTSCSSFSTSTSSRFLFCPRLSFCCFFAFVGLGLGLVRPEICGAIAPPCADKERSQRMRLDWIHSSLNSELCTTATPITPLGINPSKMADSKEPEKDLAKLEKEQELEDAAFLENLERDSKEFNKDEEIDRIMKAFRANAYDVMDIQPGVPDEDIKKIYRKKSLLIHPDKTKNPNAQDAFDRLAKAHQMLLDQKERAKLDEAIADARMLLIREKKLTTDSEEVKDPDVDFMKEWKNKVKYVLADNEARRQRQMKAQMQEEGRQKKKEDEEIEARKRKREHEQDWEKTRDQRIGSWREFTKKQSGEKSGKKKKMKTLG
ncbi:hypothetical protein AC579_7187 [Pseudocercospora musae]|uniref:J domain-containing protein n=1 Tax=Pseudocercospora musae TaxID=113226 RepID=A0A139I465_9PEZI|nr:hypothetical protein AC579_7187 [Pseudocercospora musae]